MKFFYFIALLVTCSARNLFKRAIYTGCRVGKDYLDIGAEITYKNVKWRCTKDGFEALACFTDNGQELKVGEESNIGNMVGSCKIRGFFVAFDEWPVGQNPIGVRAGEELQSLQSAGQAPTPAPTPSKTVAAASRSTSAPASATSSAMPGNAMAPASAAAPAPASKSSAAASSPTSSATPAPASKSSAAASSPTSSAPSATSSSASISSDMGTPPTRAPGVIGPQPSIDQIPFRITSCDVEGKSYMPGDKFTSKRYKMECTTSGVKILACIAPDGTEVQLGERKREGGKERACVLTGNQARYDEIVVGGGGNNTGMGTGSTGMGTGSASLISGGSMAAQSAAITPAPAPSPRTTAAPSGGGGGSTCTKDDQTYHDGQEWHVLLKTATKLQWTRLTLTWECPGAVIALGIVFITKNKP